MASTNQEEQDTLISTEWCCDPLPFSFTCFPNVHLLQGQVMQHTLKRFKGGLIACPLGTDQTIYFHSIYTTTNLNNGILNNLTMQ